MKKRIHYTNEPMAATVIEDFLPAPEKLRLRAGAVRVVYDTRRDRLRMLLRDGLMDRRDEVATGVWLEYHAAGAMLAVELRQASRRAANPRALEFAVS